MRVDWNELKVQRQRIVKRSLDLVLIWCVRILTHRSVQTMLWQKN